MSERAKVPLVLLHGYVGDSREWRRQIDDLSDEFTVLACNAPGCGRSWILPKRFDFTTTLSDSLKSATVTTSAIIGRICVIEKTCHSSDTLSQQSSRMSAR